MKPPPQEVIREWLDYDPETGIFRWRMEPRPRRPLVGQVAGSKTTDGYVSIRIRGYGLMAAHRLAWIYMNGDALDGIQIDHKDGNPSNNAINNLRLATHSQQMQNRRVMSNCRSGLKGAHYHPINKNGKKWRSTIKVGSDQIFLGYFHTDQEAHQAYKEAAMKYFGEFARAV